MAFELSIANTLKEAVELKNKTGGFYLSGGTILMVINHRVPEYCKHLISLEKIGELHRCSMDGGVYRIGASVTFDEIEKDEYIKQNYTALWMAAYEMGGPQIRNRATIGGNLASCSPSADSISPLMALNATVTVFGKNGKRDIPVRNLYSADGKILMDSDQIIVSVNLSQKYDFSVFKKVGKRTALSVACINMALAKSGSSFSVSVGAAASSVRYCKKTSELLSQGKKEQALKTVLTEICPRDDRWATAEYRNTVCPRLLEELLLKSQGETV